ncbi:MAG: DUF1353 domain-containing protein [Pseudomonadota bacterium]
MGSTPGTWTDREASLVDTIAADVAMAASSAPSTEILQDIQSVRRLRRAPQPETLGAAPPSIRELLNREEDGFVGHIRVGVVRGASKQGRRVAVILEPFAFVNRIGNVRLAVIAPVQYETDFASIPGWARGFIAPFGVHAEAAVIHDWLYAIGNRGDEQGRWLADEAFREALKLLGVGVVKRNVMYRAVRSGGKKAYGRPDEFRFRRLQDLGQIKPPPAREPYLNTVAVTLLRPDEMADTEAALATDTAVHPTAAE